MKAVFFCLAPTPVAPHKGSCMDIFSQSNSGLKTPLSRHLGQGSALSNTSMHSQYINVFDLMSRPAANLRMGYLPTALFIQNAGPIVMLGTVCNPLVSRQ